MENSQAFFDSLLSSKEDREHIIKDLFDFYCKNHSIDLHDLSQTQIYLDSIHLLLISFTYIVITKDNNGFLQFVRRFIFESKNDNKDIVKMKIFFFLNFNSREEYYIQSFNSHYEIKKEPNFFYLNILSSFLIILIKN